MKKCLLLIFLLNVGGHTQGPGATVTIYGKGTQGPYLLGFRNLISGSLALSKGDSALSSKSFSVQYSDGIIMLSNPLPIGDSLSAHFNYLPISLKSRYYLHDMIISNTVTASSEIEPSIKSESFGSDLSITGSKGFSFQAGQGVDNSLSQSLNLTIAGDLIPGFRTSAHISDKSSGTNGAARRIEELDKIYINAESDNFKGTFGDFDYVQNRDPLLGFQRKLTGLNAIFSKNGNSVQGAAAFFPGEYSTITISGQDSRLGPYYLTDLGGRAGAQILQGSERVYLDGILQKRSNDYQIDYEAGTIQFAPSKIIRNESRITLDYEVAREEYSRSLYTASGNATPAPGLQIFSSILQEGDNKNSPKSFELTDQARGILGNAGANRLQAAQPGVKYTGPGAGNYDLDTARTAHYTYVGTNQGSYDVTFSFVGAGLGSYNSSGGEIYVYSGPGLGNYEPVVLLPLPQVKRYGSIGSTWRSPDSSMAVEGEFAGSLYDRNALSTIDSIQQGGSALGLVHFEHKIAGKTSVIGLDAKFRKIGRNAIFPGRIDDVERYRKYDLDVTLLNTGEKVEEITLRGGPDRTRVISLELGYLTHPDIKSRIREAAGVNWRIIGPLNITSNLERTTGIRTWLKRSAQISATLRRIQPVFRINFERRDGLDGFKYYEYYAALPASYSQNITGTTEFAFREEKYLDSVWRNKFRSGSVQQYLSFALGKSGISGELAGSYYRKHYQDYSGTDAEQRTGWTRLTYSDPMGRGSLSLNERLSSSNERLQAKNYIFVGVGRGEYKHLDGEYIKDPQGDYIVVIDELGQGEKVTEIQTALGSTFSPLAAIDPSHKIESSAGRLSLESDLSYSLKKSSNHLSGWDFLPWHSSRVSSIVLQNGQLDIRVYYYPPGGNHSIHYNMERTFEYGAPYANETANNNTRSDELSWAFTATQKLNFILAISTTSSRRVVNGLGFDIDRKSASLANNIKFAKSWTFTFDPSYEVDRQSDTGIRGYLPALGLSLTRDLEKSGRIAARIGYARMVVTPRNSYVPFQVAQGKGEGDNFEASVTSRLTITKNGRFDLTYHFENFAHRLEKHNFRTEFTVLFL